MRQNAEREPIVTRIYLYDDGKATMQTERGASKTTLVPIDAASEALTNGEVAARMRELLRMLDCQMRKARTTSRAEFVGATDGYGHPLVELTMEMQRIRKRRDPNYRCTRVARDALLTRQVLACRQLVIKR